MDTVGLNDAGQEQTHFVDRAIGLADHRNEFARTQRPQGQQHDAGGNVLQGSLQSQTNCQARGTQNSDDAGSLHAETGQHGNNDKGANRPYRNGIQHGNNGGINTGRFR